MKAPHELLTRWAGAASIAPRKAANVRQHLVVDAWLDVLVGSRVAAAVADRTVGSADRRDLMLPRPQVADVAVHEDNRLALALLAVGQRCPVDRD